MEQISTGLDVIVQAQHELQGWVEEQEERSYELSETVGGKIDEEALSFDMEKLVKKLAKQKEASLR
ncbi:hypothetical protein F443_23052 [Phytophthora nicotianae P1569]|uniref:Uncharacterized protein n=1 Tax=Phytophthora nicotianae P1569 TaxID=1317065 RepID=V9DSH6_PHYNI|nr:hypothetical protein F443_23052 [Phytophthora nicotianae P1569]